MYILNSYVCFFCYTLFSRIFKTSNPFLVLTSIDFWERHKLNLGHFKFQFNTCAMPGSRSNMFKWLISEIVSEYNLIALCVINHVCAYERRHISSHKNSQLISTYNYENWINIQSWVDITTSSQLRTHLSRCFSKTWLCSIASGLPSVGNFLWLRCVCA